MSDQHQNGPLGPMLDDEIRKLRDLAAAANYSPALETPQGPMNPAYNPPLSRGTERQEARIDPEAQARHMANPTQPVMPDGEQGRQIPISEELVERAPAQMPAIVRSMHHTAAGAIEDAARHLEEEMASCLALMRDTAVELRIQGDSQASTIELLATLIRDTHAAFRSQADKLARFRAGETE